MQSGLGGYNAITDRGFNGGYREKEIELHDSIITASNRRGDVHRTSEQLHQDWRALAAIFYPIKTPR